MSMLQKNRQEDGRDIRQEIRGEIHDTQALGAIIRQHRKSMGLTQLDAAGLCGVGERFLSELERGKSTAELGKTIQVLQRLGLKLLIQRPSTLG